MIRKTLIVVSLLSALFVTPSWASAADAALVAWQPEYSTTTQLNAGNGYTQILPITTIPLTQSDFVLGVVSSIVYQPNFSVATGWSFNIGVNGAYTTFTCPLLSNTQSPGITVCLPNASTTVHAGDTITAQYSIGAPGHLDIYGTSTNAGFVPYIELWSYGSEPEFLKDVEATCGTSFTIQNVSGCIRSGFAYLFSPSHTTVDQFTRISLASSSPFGYVYDIRDRFVTDTATTAPQALLSADLTPFLASTTGSSSIIVPVLSAASVRNTLGTNVWSFLQNLLSVCLWIGFIWYLWYKAHHLI